MGVDPSTWKPIENPFGSKVLPMSPERTVTHVTGIYLKRLAPQAGFEPATLRLTAGCSAVELLRNLGGKPSRRAPRARAGPAMVLNDRRNRQRSAASASPVMRSAERDCGLRRSVPCTSVYNQVRT